MLCGDYEEQEAVIFGIKGHACPSVQLFGNGGSGRGGVRSFKQAWSPTLYAHEWLVHVWKGRKSTSNPTISLWDASEAYYNATYRIEQGAGWVLSQSMLNACFIVSQTCSHLNLDFHTSQLHWTSSTHFVPGSPLKLLLLSTRLSWRIFKKILSLELGMMHGVWWTVLFP